MYVCDSVNAVTMSMLQCAYLCVHVRICIYMCYESLSVHICYIVGVIIIALKKP